MFFYDDTNGPISVESVISEWVKGRVWRYYRDFTPKIDSPKYFGYVGVIELEVAGSFFSCSVFYRSKRDALDFEKIIVDVDDITDEVQEFKEIWCDVHYMELVLPDATDDGTVAPQHKTVEAIADIDSIDKDGEKWVFHRVESIPPLISVKAQLGRAQQLKREIESRKEFNDWMADTGEQPGDEPREEDEDGDTT